jgi:hypothetical protein
MDIANGDISGENRGLADSNIEKCGLHGFISVARRLTLLA